jgi:hypothetical protein
VSSGTGRPRTLEPDLPAVSDAPNLPAWEAAFFSLLHPVQIAAVEAYEWIDEPMSPHMSYELLGGTWALGTVSYHVRRLADQGVLEERYREPVRGALAHYYVLAG